MKKFINKILVAIFFAASFFSTTIANAERDNESAEILFYNAQSAFYNAQSQQLILNSSPQNAQARSAMNQYYAQAIDFISRAATTDPTSGDYALLASQIYRGKGAASYAQKYFAAAEEIYSARVQKSSKDIGAKLDLAIAFYAGDARHSKNADDYQKEARHLADDVIKICRKDKHPDGVHLRAYAMACIVKDKVNEARDTLSKAVKKDPSLESFRKDFDDSIKIDSSGRLFLLYYMTIKNRNDGL